MIDFPKVDKIVLGGGHSLILGHKPPKLCLADVGMKVGVEKQGIESFGLFDSSTPNYTTYYPEVTFEDLNPQNTEFIHPVFRLLSEVIVHKQWNPIDFSKKNVLKNSMNLLVGQTVNVDHETATGNAIGSVSEVNWQKGYTTENGIEVPAGINGVLKIDGKSNPRLARGIMMEPPSIHSNSVTVRFEWERSHPNMDETEFWNKLGTYDQDGEMFRRIVTKIVSYHETSLVAHGADPFAQVIDEDGEINNPEYADVVYSFSENGEKKTNTKYFFVDYKKDTTSLQEKPTIPEKLSNKSNNDKNTIQMKEKLIALALILGCKAEEVTEENFVEKTKEVIENKESALSTAQTAKETAETNNATLTAENTTLKTEKTELEAEAKIGKDTLEATRAEATRLYKLSVGDDKADEAIVGVIANANFETAKAFVKQYGDAAEEAFSAECKDCGSKNVERLSASIDGEGTVIEDEKGNGAKEKKDRKEKLTYQERKTKERSSNFLSEEE